MLFLKKHNYSVLQPLTNVQGLVSSSGLSMSYPPTDFLLLEKPLLPSQPILCNRKPDGLRGESLGTYFPSDRRRHSCALTSDQSYLLFHINHSRNRGASPRWFRTGTGRCEAAPAGHRKEGLIALDPASSQ